MGIQANGNLESKCLKLEVSLLKFRKHFFSKKSQSEEKTVFPVQLLDPKSLLLSCRSKRSPVLQARWAVLQLSGHYSHSLCRQSRHSPVPVLFSKKWHRFFSNLEWNSLRTINKRQHSRSGTSHPVTESLCYFILEEMGIRANGNVSRKNERKGWKWDPICSRMYCSPARAHL